MRRIVLICLLLCGLGCAGRDVIQKSREPGEKVPKYAAPSPEGIYKIDNITIKFIPPGGWKWHDIKTSLNLPCPGIEFMFNEKTGPILSILVLSSDEKQDIQSIEWIKGLKEGLVADGGQLMDERFVSFLDSQAYTYELFTQHIRHKAFLFVKADRLFQISFASRDNVFYIFWPMVYESIKTFEVMDRP